MSISTRFLIFSVIKDMRMTKRYAHLNVDNMRDAIAKLGHVLVTVGTNEVAVSGVSA